MDWVRVFGLAKEDQTAEHWQDSKDKQDQCKRCMLPLRDLARDDQKR